MLHRIRVLLLLFPILPASRAAMLSVHAATSWSFTGIGANGPDYSSSSGGASAQLNFGLDALPPDAVVLSATLNVIPSASFYVTPSDADSGCLESGVIRVTSFIETLNCSEVDAADFLDEFNLDASAPGVPSLNLYGPPPVIIDPRYIHPGGVMPVTVFDSASATFTGWYDPSLAGQTPALLTLSGYGAASGDLSIDYVVTPEPGTSALLLAASAFMLARRFARAKCPSRNGTKSRCIV